MSAYSKDINEILSCTPADAEMIEDIMRNEVFHSTLDWQTEAQFSDGAKQAHTIFEANRSQFEEYYQTSNEVLEELRSGERGRKDG